ncbi:MAG: SDR family NAD(P)-dependent oxidoreductase, partial [Lachnospiraceae bacterium]|nr:SDR family NAD(P)-dependent oxidoreductase [Lachnospiraceae bacterium]
MFMVDMFSLEGKVAWVTGAAYGIGFSMAEALAGAGAKVVFNCRSKEHLDSAMEEYKKKGIDATGYICDVTDETAVAKLVSDIKETYGPIQILVN